MTTRKPGGKLVAGRFEIERVAGSGGMGVVYRAHDLETGGAVALKVLLERDQGPEERFAHEVRLLSSLDHSHIVGYVSHGTTEEGSPFLVMPWLAGVDLQERLKAGPLSVEETLALARAVADALAYLHGRGLVHRDLKPSNLFLPEGKVDDVKLIDLGVARASVTSQSLTLSGVLIGTPGFIAPEQARGDREIAPAVDIFALGCVLYECLTGRRLFNGAHLMSVLAKILLEDAPRVTDVRPDAPPALDVLIHRMVAKEPEKRPRDGTDLLAKLADIERTPGSGARSIAVTTLTESERRVVTVLVVLLPSAAGSADPQTDETRAEIDPLHGASLRYGVRAQVIAERMAIVLAPERASAADQAAVLARFALHVVQAFRDVRLALTTGTAITGARLPVGEAIERAVTLVRATTPAVVQVDESTAALITARFDIHRVDGRLLLGAERLALDPARLLLGKPTSCVGRDRELALMDATFAACADGEGPKVLLVTAPAGAGKSRLQHELVRRLGARSSAPWVLEGRGDPLRIATPYALVAQTVRHASGLQERLPPEIVYERLRAHVSTHVAPADVARVTSFLGELIDAKLDDYGDVPLRAARQDAIAMGEQIAHAFEDIVRAWSRRRSLLLLLEDLHWSDAASVRVLDRALRKLAGADVFVVALARPDVHERFPSLFQSGDVTEVHLPPIPKRACAKLVREVIGDRARDAEIEWIVERSEGNGFYLEELIRAVAEDPGGLSVARSPLPETVLAVAQARLERLEPGARKVLRAASVFGETFWLEGVAALLGEEPAALAARVAWLIEQEMIYPIGETRFVGLRELRFRHALLRETAYATLTDDDRALGHRLAATWLDRAGEDSEAVALHWLEGGDRHRAAACFSLAGGERWQRCQAEAAARCVARALLVVDGGEEPVAVIASRVRLLANALASARTLDAWDVLLGLERHVEGKPRALAEAHALVRAALDRALRALRQADPEGALPGILADAACALGAISDFDDARALLAEATTRAGGGDYTLPALRHSSGRIAFWSGDGGAALEILGDTLLPDDPQERMKILLVLAGAVVMADGPTALARALDFVSRAEAVAGSLRNGGASPRQSDDDPVAQFHCAKARAACFLFAGEYERGVEAEMTVVALARRTGLRFYESAHLHNAGEHHLHLGDRVSARAALLESYAIARDVGADRLLRHNEMLLAYLDGRADQLAQMAESARTTSDRWLELYTHYWLGHLLASSKAPGARSALEQAAAMARALKFRMPAEDCARALAALDAAAT